MISSKKYNFVAILLTALVLVGTISAMLMGNNPTDFSKTGEYVFGDIHSVTVSDSDYYTDYSPDSAVQIVLCGDRAESSGKDVSIEGCHISILGGGIYEISGSLSDGSIDINAQDGAPVRLVLGGVDITSSESPAICINQSTATVISLAPGSENVLSDSGERKLDDGNSASPAATLYSKDDLVINGEGSLTVNGNCLDGIKANDTLKITGGNITVNAVDDGINANDYVAVFGSFLNVNSGGDAVKCEHTDTDKGFVAFDEAQLAVVSGGDGVYASSGVYLNDTTTYITSGGGSANAVVKRGDMGGPGGWGGFGGRGSYGVEQTEEDTISTKGIKAGTNLEINGGIVSIDSCEDALHSDNNLTVTGADISVWAGDDAVHAEMELVLNPASLNIYTCYEGLESAYIRIDGGEIRILSSDDGINATGENSYGGMGMMPPGSWSGEEKISDEDIWLTVNGGHIYIETSGDGFDSNGSAVINGGFLEVYGPENNGNGSIDVGDGGYTLLTHGGSLLAAGSSGMTERPSASSEQKSIIFYLDYTYPAGSNISLKDSDGVEIISGTSGKSFSWICISDEALTESKTYTLFIDGAEISSLTAADSYASSDGRGNMPPGGGGMPPSGGPGGHGRGTPPNGRGGKRGGGGMPPSGGPGGYGKGTPPNGGGW